PVAGDGAGGGLRSSGGVRRLTALLLLLQVYVSCQSMLIVLVRAVPCKHRDLEGILVIRAELAKHIHFARNFTSILTEWYLTEQESYKEASSLFFAGMFRNLTFGLLSDKLGRKQVYISGLFDFIFRYVTDLAPNYDIVVVAWSIVIMKGRMVVSFVLTQEYVGKFQSFRDGIWDIFYHCYWDTCCFISTCLWFYQVKSVVVQVK
ncbi:LOW QUALITY PROTEIN: solute carrier family 22 member 15-like, partial [Acridotheres tristis]